jgi:hypothetical protein
VKNTILTDDYVNFEGLVVQQEGFNGPNSWNNSIDAWKAPAVQLGTSTPFNVTSFVPKSGGTFFTGNGLPPTSDDPTNTRVTVPPLPNFTTANLFETQLGGCTGTIFAACFSSQLTIPTATTQVFDPYLKIILQQDASTLRPIYGANTPVPNINLVVIRYTSDSGSVYYLTKDSLCPGAPSNPSLVGWPVGQPCLAEAPISTVTSSHTPDVCSAGTTGVMVCTPQRQTLSGYFKWVILNTKNGSYTVD